MALEWAQTKTARRTNRKSRRKQPLKPRLEEETGTGDDFLSPPFLTKSRGMDFPTRLLALPNHAEESNPFRWKVELTCDSDTQNVPMMASQDMIHHRVNASFEASLGHGGTAQLTVPMEGLLTFSTTSDSSEEKKWIEGIHNDDDDEVIRSGSDSPPPGLCSTPGSDNSFVDDYW